MDVGGLHKLSVRNFLFDGFHGGEVVMHTVLLTLSLKISCVHPILFLVVRYRYRSNTGSRAAMKHFTYGFSSGVADAESKLGWELLAQELDQRALPNPARLCVQRRCKA